MLTARGNTSFVVATMGEYPKKYEKGGARRLLIFLDDSLLLHPCYFAFILKSYAHYIRMPNVRNQKDEFFSNKVNRNCSCLILSFYKMGWSRRSR